MRTIFVRPARAGLVIRMPEREKRQLPQAGANVPMSEYWIRRLQDGSVVKGAASVAPAETEAPAKPRAKKEA